MSGPITPGDEAPLAVEDAPSTCEVQVVDPKLAEVGGFQVRRVLPRRGRRMVGAWCFVDQMGPGQVHEDRGLDVGPHPHIGLQTVTWLVQGAILHRDSLGFEQLIRPGELNLMTAGRGVSHSEETRGVHVGPLHGVQLWLAQPSTTRKGEPAFEHHAELPQVELGGARATVLVGQLAGATSPARRDTEHVGAELVVSRRAVAVPLDASFEHAVVALDGDVVVAGRPLARGQLGYLGLGRREAVLEAPGGGTPVRVLLIGGAPFPEQLLMWWNYVARTRDEIIEAHDDWTRGAERFGAVASPLDRIDVAGPPWPAG